MNELRPITARTERLAMIVVAFAVTLGIYLRWWNLGGPSLWFDEGYTAWLASNPCGEIIRLVRVDTAPPLYYLLLHGWMTIFGSSELALRSFSCTAATLTMAIVYCLCRRQQLTWRQIAVAMSLLSMSVLQVRYARDARCYALVSLFAAIQLYAFIAYRSSRSLLSAAVFVLSSAAMLYTHNMTLLYVAATLGAWTLLGEGTLLRRFLESTIAGAAIISLYLPWLASLLKQVSSVAGKFWIPRPDLHDLLRTLQVILGLREDFAGNNAPPVAHTIELLACAAVAGFAILLAVELYKRDRLSSTLAIYAVSPVLVVFFYSLFRTPLLIDRVFIPSSVGIALFAAFAVKRMQFRLSLIFPAVLLLAGVSSVGYIGYEQKEDWRSAMHYLDETQMRHSRALVFLANEGELLHHYYARTCASQVTGLPTRFLESPTPKAMQRVESSGDLSPLLAIIENPNSAEIDLIVSHGSRDKDRKALTLLNETCRMIDKRTFPNVTIYRYARDEEFIARGD